MPELVRTVEDGGPNGSSSDATLSVIYQDMVAVLTLVVQEQQQRIDSLEEAIARTGERIGMLEELVQQQADQNRKLMSHVEKIIGGLNITAPLN